MSNITNHERSGVYSVYQASSVISGKTAGAVVGLAAVASAPNGETLLDIYHYEQALDLLPQNKAALRLVELILRNGASAVVLAPVVSGNYQDAFFALQEREEVSILVCDVVSETAQSAAVEAVTQASALRKERIAVLAAEAKASVSALIARANAINSERVILVAPEALGETATTGGPALAAALAGALAGESDPALPLGGVELRGLSQVSSAFSEESIDALIRGGVTVVERAGGALCVIRGVTTRTKTGGVADFTWRELSTIRIVDDVIPTIRDGLRARFARSKNTQQVRSAIRSQVILELESKLRQEIITEYGQVRVAPLEENPTVCLVEFSFAVTHGLNQIWLSANISV